MKLAYLMLVLNSFLVNLCQVRILHNVKNPTPIMRSSPANNIIILSSVNTIIFILLLLSFLKISSTTTNSDTGKMTPPGASLYSGPRYVPGISQYNFCPIRKAFH